VFERFVSLAGAGGSGLGLAIARGMARSSGGEVEWADGAMRVRLPLG
jgi:signal transduction histidine kinase